MPVLLLLYLIVAREQQKHLHEHNSGRCAVLKSRHVYGSRCKLAQVTAVVVLVVLPMTRVFAVVSNHVLKPAW